MDRRLQINVKVIGDAGLAAPYIALGKRIVQQALSRGKKTFHMRTGVNGKWKLEVLVNKRVAFITVETEGNLRFYTVNVHRVFENDPNTVSSDPTQHDDMPTRLGCNGLKGREIYRKILPANNDINTSSPLTGFSFYPPPVAIDQTAWLNFRPVGDGKGYYVEPTLATYDVNGLGMRALRLSQTPRPPRKESGEDEKLAPTFPAPFGASDYNVSRHFVLTSHSFQDTGGNPLNVLMLSVTAGAYNEQNPPNARFQFFPLWAYSHDGGASWTAAQLVIAGFTPETYSSTHAQEEFIKTGLMPVRQGMYRDFLVWATVTTGGFLDVKRIFILRGTFAGMGGLSTEDEGNCAALMAFQAEQQVVAGTSSAEAKARIAVNVIVRMLHGAQRYNLGEGRLLLVVRAQDLVNSRVDVVIPEDPEEEPNPDSVDNKKIRYACYAFVSNDYGLTFEARQTWGDNAYPDRCRFDCKDSTSPSCYGDCNRELTGKYGGPLAGISDRHNEALLMNAGCAVVLAQGCIWRAQFDPNPPYNATFYFSNNGGDTWTETARPREGVINHLMVSLPVVFKEAPSVPLTPENTETRGKTAGIALNVYTPDPETPGIGDWAIYYTRDSGATWKKGYVWESGLPPPEPRDAARFRSLSCIQAKLLNGVLDPQDPP